MISQQRFDAMASQMGLSRDPAATLRRIEALERLLERSIPLPGLRQRVGIDAALGLVPVVGDVIAAAMSAYLIWEARNLGMSKWQMTRMGGNVVVDTALGAIPFIGDLFDVAFRSNTRNLRVIRRHIDRHHPSLVTLEGSSRPAR